jgi:hypothetical protein
MFTDALMAKLGSRVFDVTLFDLHDFVHDKVFAGFFNRRDIKVQKAEYPGKKRGFCYKVNKSKG